MPREAPKHRLTDHEVEEIRMGVKSGLRGPVLTKWLELLLRDRDERRGRSIRHQEGAPMATDEELLARLKDEEDALVERKTAPHHTDVRAAVCAFANSVRAPQTGVLFLGVDRKGEPTGKVPDPDKLQIEISSWITQCYPLIGGFEKHALLVNGKHVVAVVVSESHDRPHFTGPAYIRDGSQTREASADQFRKLIEDRTDLVWALRPWVGKRVSIQQEAMLPNLSGTRWGLGGHQQGILVDINRFYVTIGTDATSPSATFSLQRVMLEHDVRNACPLLRVSMQSVSAR